MNDSHITIALLAGTSRTHRQSIKAVNYVAAAGNQLDNVEVIIVDPQDFSFPGDGNDPEGKDSRYGDIVNKADAYFIVTPEYNHSIPGSLKRMLDSEYAPYFHKPVALAGVSNGPWGGVRVCEALLPVCHRLGMVNILPELYFPKIQDIFDETGTIKPEFEAMYEENTRKAYDELVWLARLLKAAR